MPVSVLGLVGPMRQLLSKSSTLGSNAATPTITISLEITAARMMKPDLATLKAKSLLYHLPCQYPSLPSVATGQPA